MVFFTCNNCGEAVKKSSVEKHYNQKCRGNPVRVSCMDCLNDFNDNEYAAHTKCLTEAEKYSGKSFVPKESKGKGAKKQESWIDIVHSILESKNYNLKPAVRVGLERLKRYENVPRKKAKFQNFAIKCVYMTQFQAAEVWSILEKELEKIKPKPPMGTTESEKSSPNNDKISAGTDLSKGSKADTEKAESPKKKKSKISQKTNEVNPNEKAGAEEVVDSEADVVAEKPNPSKKKKSKKSKSVSNGAVLNGNAEADKDQGNREVVLENKKIKNKKQKKHEANTGEMTLNGNTEPRKEADNHTEFVTKKRKSEKSNQNSAADTDEKEGNDTHVLTNEQNILQMKDTKKTKKRSAIDDATEIPRTVNKKSKIKNKSESGDQENNQSIKGNNENSIEGGKKSKKRKKVDLAESNAVEVSAGGTTANALNKKLKVSSESDATKYHTSNSSKIKNASKEILSSQTDENVTTKDQKHKKEDGIENKPTIHAGMGPFLWTAVIRDVVGKHADGIALDILQKKVLKKYIEDTGHSPEISAKEHKKFQKRLRKYIKNVPMLK